MPLNRGIKYNFLFPFNFIPTALLGLSLDILKSPFYILGAVIGFLNLYSFDRLYLFIIEPNAKFLTTNSIGIIFTFLISCSLEFTLLMK